MSSLDKVQKGRKLKPLAMLVHAPHGLGKTKFAEETRVPVFVGAEENGEIDSPVLPRIKTWAQLQGQLGDLLKDKHDYKTLIIDTVDGLQQVAEQVILAKKHNKGKTMTTANGGFQKAFDEMGNMFLNLRDDYLIPLRDEKKMNIIILTHSNKVKHEDPMTNASYDHFETSMHKKVKPYFEDWVSAILFINFQLFKAESSSGKEYVEGDGSRVIYTEERPSHVAKNRFKLEYEYDFKEEGTFDIIKKDILKYYSAVKVEKEEAGGEFNSEVEEIKETILELKPKLPEEIRPAIETSVGRAGEDIEELKRVLEKMQGILA